MNPIEIGERIAKLRKEKGLSQSDLARALNIKPQAVQKWESGGSIPRIWRLQDIAAALSVGLPELISGTKLIHVIGNHDIIDKKNDDSYTVKAAELPIPQKDRDKFWSNVPLISWEKAATWGTSMKTDDTAVLEWILIPHANEGTFCLRIEDESAVARDGGKSYAPGDVIAVDPTKAPKNRNTVVVVLKPGSRAVVRQILTDGDRIMFRTINPDWPNRLVEMTDEVELIGTVTGKWVPED